jgi:hypothetical protein
MTDAELIRTLEAAIDYIKGKSVPYQTRPAAPAAAAPQGDLPWHEGKVIGIWLDEQDDGKMRGKISVKFAGEESGMYMSTWDAEVIEKIRRLNKGDRARVKMRVNKRNPKFTDLLDIDL